MKVEKNLMSNNNNCKQMLPSMTIRGLETKTPYSDATQVSTFTLIRTLICYDAIASDDSRTA
jgi:hypothetical protein